MRVVRQSKFVLLAKKMSNLSIITTDPKIHRVSIPLQKWMATFDAEHSNSSDHLWPQMIPSR